MIIYIVCVLESGRQNMATAEEVLTELFADEAEPEMGDDGSDEEFGFVEEEIEHDFINEIEDDNADSNDGRDEDENMEESEEDESEEDESDGQEETDKRGKPKIKYGLHSDKFSFMQGLSVFFLESDGETDLKPAQ